MVNKRTKIQPFWESIPLEELAQQQRVTPVEDLDELSDLWPVDDDPDKLLRYIRAEGSDRRSSSGLVARSARQVE